MTKSNPIDKARKAYEDALEAGIHIDIGSHNTRAKNPARRMGTAKPRRVSQITKKPPTKRLVSRRKANTAPGYFPNPAPYVESNFVIALNQAYDNLKRAVHNRKSETVIQAHVSYVQGMVDAATYLEYFDSAAVGQKWKREIAKLVPLRMI